MRMTASHVNSRLALSASAAIAVSLALTPASLVPTGRDSGVRAAAAAQPHSSTSSSAGGPLDSANGFSWG
jgi:hypothetical protein